MKRLILLSALFLSGCSAFSPVKIEPSTKYLINKTPTLSKRKMHSSVLLVLMPEASSIYNTNDMAYSTKPYQIAYFAKNQWAETPPQMLQSLLIQTLQNTHYFRAVITPAYAAHYNFILNTQLFDLHQDFTKHPAQLKLKLRAQLIRATTNTIIATKTCAISRSMSQSNPYAGVHAANEAMAICLKEIASLTTGHRGVGVN